MCLAHGLARQAEVTQEGAGDLGGYKACPGSPDGIVVTRGDTPLPSKPQGSSYARIIWLYNPELATEEKRGNFDLQNHQLDIFHEVYETHVDCLYPKTPVTENTGILLNQMKLKTNPPMRCHDSYVQF